MKLPFAEEIRDARGLAEEAARASMDLVRVEASLVSVGVFEHQLRLRPELPLEPFPGEDLVAELTERWAPLGDLASALPRSSESSLSRLHSRRDQLEAARLELRPIAGDGEARSLRLHELQHRQREALEDGRWADVVAELAVLGADRDRLAAELRPVEQRLLALRPMRAVIAPLAERVRNELRTRESEDPKGFLAWRAGHVARAILESLAQIMAPVFLELPLPPSPIVAEAPDGDPEAREAIWSDLEGVADRLGELAAAIDAEAGALEGQRQLLQGRADEIHRKILERMG